MPRLTVIVFCVLAGGCVDSQNVSIEIPFSLLSSDELQAPQAGEPCTYAPVTQAGGQIRESGLLEVDPNLNPNAGYELVLQVENFLSQESLTDSTGDTLSGPQANDFLVTDAIVQYIPEQNYLEPGMPTKAKFLTSGDVETGGAESAAGIAVQTMTPQAISAIINNLAPNVGASGDIVLEIYLEGTLGSGEPVVSGTYYFPLHVCYDCGGNSPLDCVGLAVGTMTPGLSHGPCCAPQDFTETCINCGGVGEPPCAPPQIPGGFTCTQASDCDGLGMPCNVDAGYCECTSDSDCTPVYGAGSQCLPAQQNVNGVETPYDVMTCTGGCEQGLSACLASSSSSIQGFEPCPYPNDGVGVTGATCAVSCSN